MEKPPANDGWSAIDDSRGRAPAQWHTWRLYVLLMAAGALGYVTNSGIVFVGSGAGGVFMNHFVNAMLRVKQKTANDN